MINRRTMLAAGAAALGLAGMPGIALADDFHGFDPAKVGPVRPTTEALRAMVAEAMARTPPRNGKRYVFGYTMWGGSSPFSQLNRQGLEQLAADAGIDIVTLGQRVAAAAQRGELLARKIHGEAAGVA